MPRAKVEKESPKVKTELEEKDKKPSENSELTAGLVETEPRFFEAEVFCELMVLLQGQMIFIFPNPKFAGLISGQVMRSRGR